MGSDGEAPENSPRVKAAAFAALQNCLMRVPATPAAGGTLEPEPRLEPEPPSTIPPPIPNPPALTPERTTTGRGSAATHLAAAHYQYAPRQQTYEEQLRRKPFAQTVEDARRTLYQAAQQPAQKRSLPPGKQSMLHALIKAREDLEAQPTTNYPVAPGTPTDPGVRQSSYAKPPAPAPVPPAMPVNRNVGSNDSVARPAPPVSVATAANPNATTYDGAVSRTAPRVDTPTQIDASPMPMAVGELNNEPQTAPEVPLASDASRQSSYQGGLIGILMRRARRQADQ
jgi:hypothetical protein